MTSTAAPSGLSRTGRTPLVTVPLLGWFGVSFCALLSFYLPLSVVPTDLVERGAGPLVAGWAMTLLVTGAVTAELLAPRLLGRSGPRAVVVLGLAVMAGSSVAMSLVPGVAAALVLSGTRGAGFGLVVVVVAARVAACVPADRRGEALGWAGFVACVPAVVGLPAGLWLAAGPGAPAVSAAAAVAAALGVAATLPTRRVSEAPDAATSEPTGSRVSAAVRRPGQRRPALVFLVVVGSVGVLIAFLPTLAGDASPGTVSIALLLHALAAALARLLAGRHGDRHGHLGWLWAGLLGSVVSLLVLVAGSSPAVVCAAMTISGAAFGAAQSSSLALMFADARPEDLPAVSALWNATYDVGLGLGPLLFGVALLHASASTGLLLLVGVLLVGVPAAQRHTTVPDRPGPRRREPS